MKLHTTKEAAEIIGVSERTLIRWRAEGKGPQPVHLENSDRLVRYTDDAIREWVESHTEEPNE